MSVQEVSSGLARGNLRRFAYEQVIDDICASDWTSLTQEDRISVAWLLLGSGP
jgi:hypothetical protein